MQDLVEKLSCLLREHAELKSDYLSERDNRRNYQNRVEEAHRAVGEYERQLVCSLNLNHINLP
jgi:protein-tyrosine phosphatase